MSDTQTYELREMAAQAQELVALWDRMSVPASEAYEVFGKRNLRVLTLTERFRAYQAFLEAKAEKQQIEAAEPVQDSEPLQAALIHDFTNDELLRVIGESIDLHCENMARKVLAKRLETLHSIECPTVHRTDSQERFVPVFSPE